VACGDTSAATWDALTDYGAAIGLAFQVVDDILDVTQDSAVLGKTAGKDQDANKPTYVSLMGLDGARAYADRLRSQAHAALSRSGLTNTAWLSLLADRVVDRDN
jgi:farnesyl diphosphate synthase